MPNFKNAKAVVGDSSTVVYTATTGKASVILHCQVANRDIVPRAVSVWWVDASDGAEQVFMVDGVVIPDNASLVPISGKLILEEGDQLVASQDSSDPVVEVSVSLVEVDA